MSRHRKSQTPSRREFLWHSACAAVGATAMATTVWDLRLINAATAASLNPLVDDYKALVCLFLFGGNDANNMIVPVSTADYNAYASARGGLALTKESLLPITPVIGDGRNYGLHPSMPEIRTLFDDGKA